MKIKGYVNKKSLLRCLIKKLLSKKVRIVIKILFLLLIFFIGTLFGLFVTGFFGSLDNPSPKIIKVIYALGVKDLAYFQSVVKSILNENIKIPINYIKGKLSSPERIYINIKFEDYQKIAYKREQSLLLGIHFQEEGDYVPATIKYRDKEVKIDLRLKGDMKDHWISDKWSFRIKIKGDETLFGMKIFSIQNPKTRSYIHEQIFQKALKREGVLSLRTKFIEVIINGENKGIYGLEEHFDKRLIENNRLREGPIIKFNEDLIWKNYVFGSTNIPMQIKIKNAYYATNIDSFQTSKVMGDPILYNNFLKTKNLLELFRQGKLKTSQVFDIDEITKYFAISQLMGAHHSLAFTNNRFYYNPITSKLELIGYDGMAGEEYMPVFIGVKRTAYINEFFEDVKFFEMFLKELERISEKSYLDEFFLEIQDDIQRDLNILHKDNMFYYFSNGVYYKNQENIKRDLNPIKAIQTYFDKSINQTIILKVANIQIMPIKIENLVYNRSAEVVVLEPKKEYILNSKKPGDAPEYKEIEFNLPKDFVWSDLFIKDLLINHKVLGTKRIRNETIFPWENVDDMFLEEDFIRQPANFKDFDFLIVNKNKNSIYIKEGYWVLNKNFIIPKGFTVYCDAGTIIDLKNNSVILSYSNIKCIGNKENPIKIISSDGTGQGLVVLNADETSYFEYVIFENLDAPSQNSWELTGAITFYESSVDFDHSHFLNSRSEDSLNIISSNFEIRNSFFNDSFSDSLDIDFGEGMISQSFFVGCGNDCIDISGSVVNISDVTMFNVNDKGLSIGEKSNVIANNIYINKSKIGIASKDMSELNVNNIEISNSKYGFAIYQKKQEFGPASIKAFNIYERNNENEHIVEMGSVFLRNKNFVIGNKNNVYEYLYGEE